MHLDFTDPYLFFRAVRAHVKKTRRFVLGDDVVCEKFGFNDVESRDTWRMPVPVEVTMEGAASSEEYEAVFRACRSAGDRLTYVNSACALSVHKVAEVLSRVRGQPERVYGAERRPLIDYEIRLGVQYQRRGDRDVEQLVLRCIRGGVVVGEAERDLSLLRTEHELLVFARDTLAAYLVVQAQNMLQLDGLPYFQSAEGMADELGTPFLSLVDTLRGQRAKKPKTLKQMKEDQEERERRDDALDGRRFSGGW